MIRRRVYVYSIILICFTSWFLICPVLYSFLYFLIMLFVFISGVCLPSYLYNMYAFVHCNYVAAAAYQFNIYFDRSLLLADFVFYLFCILLSFHSLSSLYISRFFIPITFIILICFNHLLLTSHNTRTLHHIHIIVYVLISNIYLLISNGA